MRKGMVTTDAGEAIAYVVHGEQLGQVEKSEQGRGDTVLLISGWGGDARSWEAELAAFGRGGRCLTLEHPGLAGTPEPAAACTTADMADRIARGLAALGVQGVAALGMSMGGAVAQELALRHPQLVRRLVLSGTFARLDRRAARALDAAARLLATGDQEAALQLIYWMVFGADFHREHLPELDALLLAGLADPVPLAVFQYQAAACIAHDTAARLANIACPTLVTHGCDDILVPLESARQLAGEIPKSQLLEFPGCGHCHLWEDPSRYRRAVLEFLAG